jgi:hypothetical protein
MLPASHQGEVAFGDANFHLRTSLGGGDNHDETRPHIAFLLAKPTCFGQTQTARVHRHYIAADAVDWDLCPGLCQQDMKVEGLLNSIHRTGTAQNWRCRKGQMETADMFPDNLGIWMFHCHIDDYMEAGMSLLYKVEPRRPAVVTIAHYRMKLSFKTQYHGGSSYEEFSARCPVSFRRLRLWPDSTHQGRALGKHRLQR